MVSGKEVSYKLVTNWIILGIFMFVSCFLFAQENKIAFEKYGVAEGLPEEFAGHVVQDDQGFMWIATQNGLVKYDGYDFNTYRYTPDDTSSRDLQIRNLLGGLIKASDGKLWVGGYYGGVASFDPKTEKFNHFFYNPDDPEALSFAINILRFEDVSGNIWFYNFFPEGDTGIICRINSSTNQLHKYPVQLNFDFFMYFMNMQIFEIAADSSLWLIDSEGQLRKWNNSEDVFDVVIKQGSDIPGTGIQDTLLNINSCGDELLMVGKQGLYVLDPFNSRVNHYYYSNTDNENGLHPTPINLAFKDHKDNIWVLHEEGKLSVISPNREMVTRMQYGESPLNFGDTLSGITILHTLQDDEGIWFQVLSDNGPTFFIYYHHATTRFTHYDSRFNYEHNKLSNSGDSYFWKFTKDKTGLIWLNTRPNLYKESPKANQLELFRNSETSSVRLPSDTVTYLHEDSKGRIWIGTTRGLVLYNPDRNTSKTFRHDPANSASISNNSIRSVFEASDGKIWVATSNGLNILLESGSSFKRLFFNNVATNRVRSELMEDYLGRIWVSIAGKGVFILDRKNGDVMEEYRPEAVDDHGMGSAGISVIFQDSRNDIWLGDRADGEFALFYLKKGDSGFKHYSFIPGDATSIANNEILYIAEDPKNRIWIGTDGGLYLFNADEECFVRYGKNQIPSTSSYAFGANGEIWVSTYSGNGLVSVNADTKEVRVFGEAQGLAHNDGSQAFEKFAIDDYGKFWLPNQRGLSVFDPANGLFKNYTTSDGFQEYCRFYTAKRTRNGDIWIGGLNGLNHIKPDLLLKSELSQPDVWITAVDILKDRFNTPDNQIFKKAISLTEEIHLDYNQKDISFEFVGLHYLRPEDNLYSWKLENYDMEWTRPSKERKAVYTNLLPGTYTFRVKASNADGIWSENGASLKVNIAPPWWESTTAYIFYGFLFISLIVAFDRLQRKRIKEKERAQAREKELEQAREIEKAYTELKATQTQLVQAEKMASLGELTAGIAHEIQNPLNFVNNFSEVNRELITELREELENGNLAEVKAITGDLEQNEEKISHHGKRADAIVRGMLQHSRTGSGQKEPTDLNALADEYLRLSYHGLRAKDKSFNAHFHLEADENLPKINVVPQDMGRVLLNLINNAFHAVHERNLTGFSHGDAFGKNLSGLKEKYKPTITITTKNLGDKIEIRVQDNGNGIPDEIKDKIFQPFFTTKPTGEGTGLGLSMSYDIITKGHGGKLTVDTTEGKGTIFTIQLLA